MNERAKELGCVDSNFVNPNGLPNEDHYTSAYDLAMIGRAFFANEALCKMTMTHMLQYTGGLCGKRRHEADLCGHERRKSELL